MTTPSPPHADPRPTLSGAKTTVSAINQIKKAGGLDQFLKGSLMHLIKGFLPYKDKGKNDMANPLDIIPSVNDIGHSESDKGNPCTVKNDAVTIHLFSCMQTASYMII